MSVAVLDVALDEALVARAAAGDQDAFGDLYARYAQSLYDFAARTIHDRDLASDVVQNTFTRAWEAIQKGTQPQNVRAWLYTIARNDAIDQLRRMRRIVPDSADEDGISFLETRPDPGPAPDELVHDQELASLVWTAAASLNPRQYSLLDLHLRQNLTPDELAASLGLRRDNVYMMLSRLRDSLEESVSLLLLMRRGRRECRDLDALLAGHQTPELTREMRRVVRKHLDTCGRCQEHSRRYISPAEIFAGLAAIPISAEASELLWQQRIVPQLDPSSLLPLAPLAPSVPIALPSPIAPPVPPAAPVPTIPPVIESGWQLLQLAAPALVVKAGIIAATTVVSLAVVVTVALQQPDPISVSAPRDPDDVRSGSHQVGQPSLLNIIQILWSPVEEMLGYSVSWSPGERDLPDAVSDLPGTAAAASSPPLPAGTWYFHLRTRGPGGEWTSTVHLGPFVIVAPPSPPAATAAGPPPIEDNPLGVHTDGDGPDNEGLSDLLAADMASIEFAVDDSSEAAALVGPPAPTSIPTATASPTSSPTAGPGSELEQQAPILAPTLVPSTLTPPRVPPTRTVAPTPVPQITTGLPVPPGTAPPVEATPVEVVPPFATAPAETPGGANPTSGPIGTRVPQPRSVGAAPTSTSAATLGPTASAPTARTSEPTRVPTGTPTRGVGQATPLPSLTATSAAPTRTPCVQMTITTLNVRVQAERVVITWGINGGCAPYSGTIAASRTGAAPYQTYPITALSGTINDTPPHCAGLVTYRLNLIDASGATVTGNATALVDRDC